MFPSGEALILGVVSTSTQALELARAVEKIVHGDETEVFIVRHLHEPLEEARRPFLQRVPAFFERRFAMDSAEELVLAATVLCAPKVARHPAYIDPDVQMRRFGFKTVAERTLAQKKRRQERISRAISRHRRRRNRGKK